MNRREAVAALMSLPAAAKISRAEVQVTDVIVLEYDGPLSEENVERIREVLKGVWPGNKCLVIGDGGRLKIASRASVGDNDDRA